MAEKANGKTKKKELVIKDQQQSIYTRYIPRAFIGVIADEVAKTVVQRLPNMLTLGQRKKSSKPAKNPFEGAFFLDTSAIIDGRIFEVVNLGLLHNHFVVLDSILKELKRIADSQDVVKKGRGRKGLSSLETLKKTKGVKVSMFSDKLKNIEVDEKLITSAKQYKGKILTCDFNLAKKASIEGVVTININELAHILKITAVPGEEISLKVLHIGKDAKQGVGYLDDGTMVVVEEGAKYLQETIHVIILRVIQTDAGRILFAKKIQQS